MQIKIAKHPSGQEITFTEEDHKYVSEDHVYKSATSILKDYFPVFDQENIAKRYALKHNTTPKLVIAEWEAIAKKATDHGTMVHAYLECLLLGQDPGDHCLTDLTVKALKEISDKIKTNYDVIESEKIVFCPDLKISGTMDLFAYSTERNEYLLADWKTNKKMELDNIYNKYGSGPFMKVPDNNFGHYSLQVHLYKEMIIREKYIKNAKKANIKCLITHIPSSEEGVFKNYLAEDYSKEIKALFKHLKLQVAEDET